MTKNEWKMCLQPEHDIGNKPHTAYTLDKESIFRNVKAWFKRTEERLLCGNYGILFTEKTKTVLSSFFECLKKGCIDRIPPCKYTTANELCHSYLNQVEGRWKGPWSMTIEEYEFVSNYTLTYRPIPGMIKSAQKFRVLKERGHPSTQRKFDNLPNIYRDCFQTRLTQLPVPPVIRDLPEFVSKEVFINARNIYRIRSLLFLRHFLLR